MHQINKQEKQSGAMINDGFGGRWGGGLGAALRSSSPLGRLPIRSQALQGGDDII